MKRLVLGLALLGAGLVGVSSCSDSVTYSYVQFPLKIDASVDTDTLAEVGGCTVVVEGATSDSSGIPICSLGLPGYRAGTVLGNVDFSTTTTGVVRFTVSALDQNGKLIASGKTGDVTIQSGGTVMAPELVLQAVPKM